MPTIKDVAVLAGVSYTTVSHVLNRTRPVAADTAARVMKAVDELGFVPNTVARGLRSGRSRTIGIITSDINDHFFSEVAQGIETVCYENGYDVYICYAGGDCGRELAYIDHLRSRDVDGLIMNSLSGDRELADAVIRFRKPVVLFQRWLGAGGRADGFVSDDYRGMTDALEHLWGLGHRRIGFVYGPTHKSNTASERLRAYRDFLGGKKLPVDESIVRDGHYSMETASEVTASMLSLPDKPTAIAYFSDPMALGGMAAARDKGLSVPGDLSVIGYDDVSICAWLDPPLSSVSQEKKEAGKRMASILFDRFADPDREAVLEIASVRLALRGSTGPARKD